MKYAMVYYRRMFVVIKLYPWQWDGVITRNYTIWQIKLQISKQSESSKALYVNLIIVTLQINIFVQYYTNHNKNTTNINTLNSTFLIFL